MEIREENGTRLVMQFRIASTMSSLPTFITEIIIYSPSDNQSLKYVLFNIKKIPIRLKILRFLHKGFKNMSSLVIPCSITLMRKSSPGLSNLDDELFFSGLLNYFKL